MNQENEPHDETTAGGRPLLRAASADEFLRDPVGRCVRGPTYLVWCFDPTICGTLYWGRPTESQARALLPLLGIDAHPAMRPPIDVLTDCRWVRRIDLAAFRVVRSYACTRIVDYAKRIRRHAIVQHDGIAGAAIAGLYPMLRPRHPWRPFTNRLDAFAWLKRADAAKVAVALDRAMPFPPDDPVEGLRLLLAERAPGAPSLAESAKALSVSIRSLQRALHTSGSTFRAEVARARMELAEELLVERDEKLDAVAVDAGFASRTSMERVFRRLTGAAPGKARPRR
jgi:AraC-like DNA-binding protein